MNSTLNLLFLSGRVVLASLIGLSLQIILVVKAPEYLLSIQESVKSTMSQGFEVFSIGSQYHVAYNLIGGDNIVIHTLFVLVAYILILLVLLPFSRKSSSSSIFT